MVRCPNCGQKTGGIDSCEWCKYPLLRGGGARRRKAEKRAEREARLAAQEEAKRKAEETRQAKEVQEQVKKEAKLAVEEEAKRKAEETGQAKEAQEQAKKEAELAAQEEAKRKAEEAGQAKEVQEQAKKEAKEVGGAELYEGEVKLTIVSPVDLDQMRKLQEYLRQVQDLHLVLVSGSVDEGTAIVVSAAKPIPLIDILKEMPPVEQVVKEGTKIQIMLKAK